MTVAATNLDQLGALLGSEHLRTEETACESFAADGVAPAAVVEPADAKELGEVVAWARAHQAALVPVTSGAYLPLGNPPTRVDVAISLGRLNRILHYDPADLTLGAEAGLPLARVQEVLADNNLFLPADPPYAERAALGGLLAANASGPLRYAYGTWRDFVVGMGFISGEGKQVKTGGRVVKNVAGYDLSKLLIGSLGTLGIVTEVNFKCFPQPPATASFVFAFAEAARALELRDAIVHSAWQPLSLDLLDPGAAKLLALASLSPDHWSLVVTVGGVDKVIRRYADDFSALARERAAAAFGVVRDEAERALRSAVRELIPRARQANARATVVKVTLPLTQIGPFLAKGRAVAERYQLPSAASAHAGSGIGYLCLLPAEGLPEAPHRMAQAATEMIHAGNNLSGRVTVPWCVTEVKRDVSVWGPLRDDFALMQKLKAQFDPDNILNPGRFLGGL